MTDLSPQHRTLGLHDPAKPRRGTVTCAHCGQLHVADFSHVADWGGLWIYAVVCPLDLLTDYYAEDAVHVVRS